MRFRPGFLDIFAVFTAFTFSATSFGSASNTVEIGVVETDNAAALDDVVRMGAANLDWLAAINRARSGQAPLSFYQPGSLKFFGIENPDVYSPKIILDGLETVLKELPAPMKAVLWDRTQTAGSELPISEAEFIRRGAQIDSLYQHALRWKLLSPGINTLSDRSRDVRGYYYLKKTPRLRETLQRSRSMSAEEKSNFREWLSGLCQNSNRTDVMCDAEAKSSLEQGTGYAMFETYHLSGEFRWNEYFTLPPEDARKDIQWSRANPSVAKLEFTDSGDAAVNDFLKRNIEDEWRGADWALKIVFVRAQAGHPRPSIEFHPSEMPNVRLLAGNVIRMDSHLALDDFITQRGIRHEFGHILGFPDCYNEFYDSSLQAMVAYQLDETNLMCSLRGRVLPQHGDALKKAYLR